MKTRDNRIIEYLRQKGFLYAISENEQDATLKNAEERIKKMSGIESINFCKKIINCLILTDFLENRRMQYYYCTNIFKVFSDEFSTSEISPKVKVNILLDMIKDYPSKLYKYDEHDSFDYVILFKKFLGKYFSIDDLSEFCRGNITPIHDILSTNIFLEYEVCTKKMNVFFDIGNINEAIKEINDCYFNKLDSFTEVDIKNVYSSLIKLGVSKTLANEVTSYLNKKYNKRASGVISPSIKQTTIEKQSKYISDKEYKGILKEIKKYYNPYTREVTNEFISSEMREYIAYLMIKIGLDKETISDFLRKTDEENKMLNYSYFKDHVEEFVFYYQDQVSDAVEYLKEINDTNSDADNAYWIAGIDDVLSKLPLDGKIVSYEYEKKKIMERMNSNE